MFNYHIDCPVCDGERKDCRALIDGEKEIYFCHSDEPTPQGMRFVGYDPHGFGKYVVNHGNEPDIVDQKVKESRRKNRSQQKDQASNILEKISLYERDQSIKNLLGALDRERVIKNDELVAPGHKKEIANRLNKDIDELEPIWKTFGVISLKDVEFIKSEPKSKIPRNVNYCPNIFNSDKWKTSKPGLALVILNHHQQMVGWQIKTDREDQPKYIWEKDQGYNRAIEDSKQKQEWVRDFRLPNGNMPLHFAYTLEDTWETINVCEGILKSKLARFIYGGVWCGAAGGNLNSELQKAIEEKQPQKIVYYPDAGSLSNPQVRQRDYKNILWLASLASVEIADWGQMENKNAGDIDETNTSIRFLTFSEYQQKVEKYNPKKLNLEPEINNRIKVKTNNAAQSDHIDYKTGCLPKPSENMENLIFKVDDKEQQKQAYKEAKAKGYKVVLDSSETGSGKSHLAGELDVSDFGDIERLFYLSQTPRNPTNKGIEQNYVEMPSRHNGLVQDDSKLTPNGNPYRRRPKGDEQPTTMGNCHWSDKFQKIKEKNQNLNPCAICPNYDKCKTDIGPGYGYISLAKQALNNGKIRANILGLSPEMATNSVGIIDEYQQALSLLDDIIVPQSEFISGIALLLDLSDQELSNKLQNKIQKLAVKINRGNFKYGLQHKEIVEYLGQPPEFLDGAIEEIENMENQNTGNEEIENEQHIAKRWLSDFLKVWAYNIGAFSADKKGNLFITKKNEHVEQVIDAFSFLVCQDATGSKKDLALKLGIKESEILEVTLPRSTAQNLKIINIQGFGHLPKRRSNQQRVNILVNHLKSKHNNNIGFIDFKDCSEKGWLNHFSDARGSNQFSDKEAVCAIGIPFPNLGGVAKEYTALTGEKVNLDAPSDHFQRFLGDKVQNEIIQEIGRLRANRRDENVVFYLVGDIDLDLHRKGYSLTKMHVASICPDALSKPQKTIFAISNAYKQAKKTVTEIAKQIDKSRSQVHRIIKEFGSLENIYRYVQTLTNSETMQVDWETDFLINDELYHSLFENTDKVEKIIQQIKNNHNMTLLEIFFAANQATKLALIQFLNPVFPEKLTKKLSYLLQNYQLIEPV